jgi:hypothetical protein
MTGYRATDDDLPQMMLEPEPRKGRIQTALTRILTTAREMGIDLTLAEIKNFAIVLIGIADDAEVRSAKSGSAPKDHR